MVLRQPVVVGLIASVGATASSAVGTDNWPALEAAQPGGIRCASPATVVAGNSYALRVLRRAWVRVGPRFERPAPATGCRVLGSRTHRLRAFEPHVALSLGGSSRRLLVRDGICPNARTEFLLLRCLRGTSRSIR